MKVRNPRDVVITFILYNGTEVIQPLVCAFVETGMKTSGMDYVKKIQFAEEWLKRAKLEFEQGSSIQAGSHILLAIAEIETVKRNIFGEDPLPVRPVIKSKARLDLRPAFAFLLFISALMIMTFALKPSNHSITSPSTVIGNTGSGDHNVASTSILDDHHTSYLDNLVGEINIPEPVQNDQVTLENPDENNSTVSKQDNTRVKPSRKTASGILTEPVIAAAAEKTFNDDLPAVVVPAVNDNNLDTLDILRQTITVANQSLAIED